MRGPHAADLLPRRDDADMSSRFFLPAATFTRASFARLRVSAMRRRNAVANDATNDAA
jgi:hypothetical protein